MASIRTSGARPDAETSAITGLDSLELGPARPDKEPGRIARQAWAGTWPKLLAIALVLGAWQLFYLSNFHGDTSTGLVKGPGAGLANLWDQAQHAQLWQAIGTTVQTAVVGYLVRDGARSGALDRQRADHRRRLHPAAAAARGQVDGTARSRAVPAPDPARVAACLRGRAQAGLGVRLAQPDGRLAARDHHRAPVARDPAEQRSGQPGPDRGHLDHDRDPGDRHLRGRRVQQDRPGRQAPSRPADRGPVGLSSGSAEPGAAGMSASTRSARV